MSHVTAVTQDDFREVVLQSVEPVLVDFWAPWCGPCLRIAPHIDLVAEELAGKVKFVKVNVDTYPDLAKEFGVIGIPNLVVFKGGRVVDQIVGAVPKQTISETVQRYLDAA